MDDSAVIEEGERPDLGGDARASRGEDSRGTLIVSLEQAVRDMLVMFEDEKRERELAEQRAQTAEREAQMLAQHAMHMMQRAEELQRENDHLLQEVMAVGLKRGPLPSQRDPPRKWAPPIESHRCESKERMIRAKHADDVFSASLASGLLAHTATRMMRRDARIKPGRAIADAAKSLEHAFRHAAPPPMFKV